MFRRPFFWIGAILWAVVLIWGFMLYQKPDSSNISEEAVEGQLVKSDEEDSSPWSSEGLPEFSLTAHTGETVTKESLLGKPWVVDFIFTQCTGPCPKISAQMSLLQEQLSETNVMLITITVDPETDTVEKLAKYAKAFDADPERWLMLTGSDEEIYDLIEHGFLMPVQEIPGADAGARFIHTTNFLYVDENGIVQEKINGQIDSEVDALRRKLVKKYKVTPSTEDEPKSEDSASEENNSTDEPSDSES
ncbi:MAG: SCO family protein [Planctomycetaceae bacterium]|nr:SCO family protein [Planctomycetaceae bacterium]